MKMIAFAVEKEEIPIFNKYKEEYDLDLTMLEEKPCRGNAYLTEGVDCINVLSDTILTPELWDIYHANGVKIAVTRCIGMEHMNKTYAESLGIKVSNVTYSPASVADYAIMLMIMLLRHVKPIMQRYLGQDYTMAGIRGRELPNMTVGIIGAGRIGMTTARHLSGFGCKILYWNRHARPELADVAEYCSLQELLEKSDIVSLHIAASIETHHFMNRERLESMKQGAILINTARGSLVDTGALIDRLESGWLAGAGLDVFEGDRYIYYRDYKNKIIANHEMAILNAMPNVLMLPHAAYFTDQALEDMVHNSLTEADRLYKKNEGMP